MKTDKVLGEEIYMKICDAVIMKYKDFNSQIIDDAVVESDEETTTSEE
jgi:hypothetical protein